MNPITGSSPELVTFVAACNAAVVFLFVFACVIGVGSGWIREGDDV